MGQKTLTLKSAGSATVSKHKHKTKQQQSEELAEPDDFVVKKKKHSKSKYTSEDEILSSEEPVKKKHSKKLHLEDVQIVPDAGPSKKKKRPKTEQAIEEDNVPSPKKKHSKHIETHNEVPTNVTSPKKKKHLKEMEVPQEDINVAKSPKKKHKHAEAADNMSKPVDEHRKKRNNEIALEDLAATALSSPKKKHRKAEEIIEQTPAPEASAKVVSAVGAPSDKIYKDVGIWPKDEMNTLFKRMRQSLPPVEKFSYTSVQDKLDWNLVAFGPYSGEDCKSMWLYVVSKLRHYRLLSELLDDAQSWVETPWLDFYRKTSVEHPDMPRKPPTAYLCYFLANKSRIQAANPGLSATHLSKIAGEEFKKLSEKEKKFYEASAQEKKTQYEENMKIFQESHPEFRPKATKGSKSIEKGPKPPPTPFQIYFSEKSHKFGEPGDNPSKLKSLVRQKWETLSDKKRLSYIKKAVEQHKTYKEEFLQFMREHPDSKIKTPVVLNRPELDLYLKSLGRPEKPSGGGYQLFIREQHAQGNINDLPKEEVFSALASRWRALGDERREVYKSRHAVEVKRFEKAYDAYLRNLPEDVKCWEELYSHNGKKKKAKVAEKKELKKDKPDEIMFPGEPVKPPSSAFGLFIKSFIKDSGMNESEAADYWEQLPDFDREKFVTKQKELMEAYRVKFETFVRSLNKREMELYRKLKKINSKSRRLPNAASNGDASSSDNKGSSSEAEAGKASGASSGSSDSEEDSEESEDEDKGGSSKSDSSEDDKDDSDREREVAKKPAESSDEDDDSEPAARNQNETIVHDPSSSSDDSSADSD